MCQYHSAIELAGDFKQSPNEIQHSSPGKHTVGRSQGQQILEFFRMLKICRDSARSLGNPLESNGAHCPFCKANPSFPVDRRPHPAQNSRLKKTRLR